MTNEDKLYADQLRNKAISDYERLNLAINELEATEQARGMTREQAYNYLKSSGMSDEQIKTVINAFTCEDCISRAALLARIDEERKHLLDLKMDGAEHILVHHARRIIEDMPTVTPKGVTITDFADRCRECGKNAISREKIKEALEKMERGLQSCFNMIHCESNHDLLEGQERAFKYCIETLKEVLDEYNTEVDGGNEFFNFDSPMVKGENDNES